MDDPAYGFRAIEAGKYLSLETYRKNGKPVPTAVWFAAAPGLAVPRFYVFTTASSGKSKRIRNNGAARIAPCDARGKVTGPPVEAWAEFVAGEEAARAMRLLGRKYWPWKQVLDGWAGLFGRTGERVVLAVRPAESASVGTI